MIIARYVRVGVAAYHNHPSMRAGVVHEVFTDAVCLAKGTDVHTPTPSELTPLHLSVMAEPLLHGQFNVVPPLLVWRHF